MPPKEEPKDNDGKEGKSALEEELNLIGGKELVLARMELDTSQNHLKEKIKENKTLMKACEELKSHLETQKADAKDIYYYLHKKLDDNYDVIDSLEKRIIVLKSERERSDELYEKKIAVINKDNEKENARLQTIIKELRDDLHTLTEFKDAKVNLRITVVPSYTYPDDKLYMSMYLTPSVVEGSASLLDSLSIHIPNTRILDKYWGPYQTKGRRNISNF